MCTSNATLIDCYLLVSGDTVHLAHVICDPRTPSTAVGSSAAATQWSPQRDEQSYAKVGIRDMAGDQSNKKIL